MEIKTREVNDVKIADYIGSLDTNTSPESESHFNELIEQGDKKILVNFANLDYISSAGLRVLLATSKKMKINGGDLRICGMNETVSEVFEISGFSTILNVHVNESDALQEF